MESWGVFLGDVSRANRSNAKGNRENRAIMDLHEAVLNANGGSWSEPPEQVKWGRKHRAALSRIIEGFNGHDCWGFKDPRTLFTLDAWREWVPGMEFLGIFRDPRSVARSLQTRDPQGFPDLNRGLELWARYNRRLLEIHAQNPFPILCFDAEPEAFARQTEIVRQKFGFPVSGDGAPFFENELRHHQPDSDGPLPPHIAELYAKLSDLAVR